MAKTKKEEVEKEEEMVESPEKSALRKKLEEYAEANPEAWKIRGERLLAKLNAMQ